jgi:hypothetical protein
MVGTAGRVRAARSWAIVRSCALGVPTNVPRNVLAIVLAIVPNPGQRPCFSRENS